MEHRCRARDYRFAVIVLLGILVALHSAVAQEMRPPTLDDILLRLDSNLHDYKTEVPSLFCNEHVVSVMVSGKNHQSTVTDSIFRLKRTDGPGQAATLTESREIRSVNGAPTGEKHLSGPSVLTGVFSGGLETVSLGQKACMIYTLQPIKPGHLGDPYIVQFATLPDSQRPSDCVIKEDGTGRVFIDPNTMQVTRMELTAPHHIIVPATVGVWRISITYAPVLLGGKTFWMPATITSKATPSADYDPTVWWFKASYADYHKLEVTSRILPSDHSAAP